MRLSQKFYWQNMAKLEQIFASYCNMYQAMRNVIVRDHMEVSDTLKKFLKINPSLTQNKFTSNVNRKFLEGSETNKKGLKGVHSVDQ